MALVAAGNGKWPSKLLCTHCKQTNHLTDYCIHPGGKMAGKSLDDAQAAQCTALNKSKSTQQMPPVGNMPTVHITTTEPSPIPSQVVATGSPLIVNGILYYPAAPDPMSTTVTDSAIFACVGNEEAFPCEHYGYPDLVYVSIVDEPSASVDWQTCS